MQLDTNVMQSRTADNLVKFINKQSEVISLLRMELELLEFKLDDKVDTECHDIAQRTELINARQQSALDFMSENKRGGRPEGRRSNGRISF